MEATIIGDDMQSLKVDLAPGEAIYTDSGKLISKDECITMTPRVVGGIIKLIERKATGATGMLTVFKSENQGGHVQIGGIFPGKILQIPLAEGQKFVSEHYAFLAAEQTVNFTMRPVKLASALFGGAGLILQEFVGPGNVWLHVEGDIVVHDMDVPRVIEVDPGHIAGFDSTLDFNIKFVDNIRTMMFGGVGMFLANFKGKGKLITHTVSRLKLSSEIYTEGLEQQKNRK